MEELRILRHSAKPLHRRLVRAVLRLRTREGMVTTSRDLLQALFGITVQVAPDDRPWSRCNTIYFFAPPSDSRCRRGQ